MWSGQVALEERRGAGRRRGDTITGREVTVCGVLDIADGSSSAFCRHQSIPPLQARDPAYLDSAAGDSEDRRTEATASVLPDAARTVNRCTPSRTPANSSPM